MYCTYCNHPNTEGNKFCENCGRPLVGKDAVPVPAPQIIAPPRSNWTRRLTSIGSALVLICFFLPWLLVSCSFDSNGNSGIEISGYEIASGNYQVTKNLNQFGNMFGGSPYETSNADMAYPLLALIPLVGALGLMALNGRTSGSVAAIIAGILGIGGMLLFSLAMSRLQPELQSMMLQTSYQIGYWGTWLGFIWLVVAGFLTVRQNK